MFSPLKKSTVPRTPVISVKTSTGRSIATASIVRTPNPESPVNDKVLQAFSSQKSNLVAASPIKQSESFKKISLSASRATSDSRYKSGNPSNNIQKLLNRDANSDYFPQKDSHFEIELLQTQLYQITYLHNLLEDTANSENLKAEADLLRYWQLVFDAEEEEAALLAKYEASKEIIRTHGSIKALVATLLCCVLDEATNLLHFLVNFIFYLF